ncbi:hybrid sensor histidine kinase/response regulator transcription factor [Spirosoma pomorum]
MRGSWYVVLLFLAALASLGAQPLQLPAPEVITARQGLPQAFVPAITQDKRGFIWMATRDGLARYDGYTFKVFQPTNEPRPSLSGPGLTKLVMGPDGYLWIQNDQFGLDGFDPLRETFTNLSRLPAYQRAFGRDTLVNVYPDSHRRLWLTFRRSGLSCYERDTQRFIHYSSQSGGPANQPMIAVGEDGWRHIWITTARGLARFEPATGHFIHVGYPAGHPATDPIRRLYRRPNGELWLSAERHLTRWNPQTRQTIVYPLAVRNGRADWHQQIASDSQGTEYLNLNQQLFRYTPAQGLQPLTPPGGGAMYLALFIDRSDVLWLGTDLVGVHKINLRATAFRNMPYRRFFIDDWLTQYAGVSPGALPAWPTGTTAYNLRTTIDNSGQMWLATGNTPLYRLNPATRQLTVQAGPVPLRDYRLERPTLLATDPDGRVWLAHPDWTGYYDPALNQWIRFGAFRSSAIPSPMLQLVVDRQALWLATASRGLYRVDRKSGQIRTYQRNPKDSTSLPNDNLYWLTSDPLNANQLWIGTFGSGLCRFDKRTGRCVRFTTRQGLPNNVVYAAIPDRWGSVWVATNQGLGQLDRRTGRVRTYRQEDGLINDEFNRFHAVAMPPVGPASGQIILGGIAGLVGFDPRAIRPDTFQPLVQVSAILVNNRALPVDSLLRPGGNGQLTDLVLPYNQNFLTVRFAAMQYNRLGQATYRYQLRGLSSDWVETNRPEAIFTALPPGRYDLRIQAANTSGQWSRHVRQVQFHIAPPGWQTGWAYGAYALLIAGLLWAYSQFRTRQIQQRQHQLNQQREADQLRRLDELKTRFFANVTHELRTPLTLILGPAQHLKTRLNDPADQQWVATIDRQAQQLLSLTNQLLDLSRLEAGVVSVQAQPGDLVTFVAQLLESVRPEADRKGLALTLTNTLPGSLYWFDADKLERITLNLLTNAIKFTQQGSVQVTLTGGVELVVADSGPGLTTAEQERVFDRYYQAEPQSAASPGSGIGLALVNELVTLQGGTVRVESPWTDAHGGARFVVQLPYQPVVDPIREPASVSAPLPATLSALIETPDMHRSDEQPLILVVEDQPELRAFIAQTVADLGRVQLADDGQAGWETALALGPDLIISDVLMPRLDGYGLSSRLKQDPQTSHIPLLLLTAKATVDDRLHGLAGGADSYLTKPFLPTELHLQVRNLLTRQQRQRAWLRQQLLHPDAVQSDSVRLPSNPPGGELPGADDPFMTALQRVLDQHLNNAQFGVDELASALHVNRVQLYRKVKALSGYTVTELIRNYRLGLARQRLRAGASVADVADAVGFESASYFARCFREQYGLTPSAYQRGQEPTPAK